MQIDTWIKKEQESLIALRRWFHMHPEPSMKEYETAAKIEEELTRIGVAHRRIRETGVFASISGEKGSGKVLVLRADGGFAGQKLSQCEFRVCTCVRP